jgi:hypothetical protein
MFGLETYVYISKSHIAVWAKVGVHISKTQKYVQ